ncbi:MAG: hypothetical protein M0R80_23535 [Proteobacteria bacterium]|jgi:hypothetical protein|nr:hypothetical protein [Pseudomonadota bacterium]
MYDPKFRVSDNLTDKQREQIADHEEKREQAMASRKVYVNVKVQLILDMDEGVDVGDVIDEVDYDFASTTDGATVHDMHIEDYEVTDSK